MATIATIRLDRKWEEKMKIKICDLCNEPIIEDLGALKVKVYGRSYDYGSIKLDICHFCKEEIIKRSKENRAKGK